MLLSWIGILLGIGGIIVGQMLEGGQMEQLIQPTAALIVFGGTLGATMLSSTTVEFSQAIRSFPRVFLGAAPDFRPLVKEIVTMATVARREGILQLEQFVGNAKSPFFQVNLRHIIDGYDPHALQEMLEEAISREEQAKMAVAKVWETAGGYSPTVGILGAVLGLIQVMSNLTDTSKLGSGIAVAFVATVYGVGAANLVLLPIGNKLKKKGKTEMMEMELIAMGLSGIQNGLNPRVIEDKLNNLLGEFTVSDSAGAAGAERKAA